MNVLEVLRQDHRRVMHLFDELEAIDRSDAPRRREVFSTLRDELIRHAHAEEKVFYARIKDRDAARDDVRDGIEEHHRVEVLIDEMAGMPVDSNRWEETLSDVRQLVQHHVGEEESKIFGEADELIHDELDEIGDAFVEAKKQA